MKHKIHENYSHDWWTPDEWLVWVSDSFGEGYYDPCPKHWNSQCTDGLEAALSGPVYVNHPGSRGSTKRWWGHYHKAERLIWCAFSVEQLRHMDPSPLTMDGWLVMPKKRIGFVWGGPTEGKRVHGQVAKSPANWTVFWSSVEPATPPVNCLIVRTYGKS